MRLQRIHIAARSGLTVEAHSRRHAFHLRIVRLCKDAAGEVLRVVNFFLTLLLARDHVVAKHGQRHVEVAHESGAVARQLVARAHEFHRTVTVAVHQLRRGLDAEPVHGQVRVVVAPRQDAEDTEHLLRPILHHGDVELDVRTLATPSSLVLLLSLLASAVDRATRLLSLFSRSRLLLLRLRRRFSLKLGVHSYSCALILRGRLLLVIGRDEVHNVHYSRIVAHKLRLHPSSVRVHILLDLVLLAVRHDHSFTTLVEIVLRTSSANCRLPCR